MNNIGVIGIGYVGLPLAVLFASKGFTVVGIDLDETKIDFIKRGKSYIRDISDQQLREVIDSGNFSVSQDYTGIESLEAIIICVPTPLDYHGKPNLTYLEEVGNTLSQKIRRGQLIILESSTYPGTTTEFLQPILESKGLFAGSDFYLGYSPERIDPGNLSYRLEQIPKIISGVTPHCKKLILDLYGRVFEKVVTVSTPQIAEMAKLLENSYRFINISFINEMAMMCDKMNINIWEVIEAAKTKPYGYAPFYPGPGIGGHCIPVDPLYLLWKAHQHGTDSAFIKLSTQANQRISQYIVEEVKSIFSQCKDHSEVKILIYGIAYKSNIEDDRETPSLPIMASLMENSFQVCYHDPFIPHFKVGDKLLKSVPLDENFLQEVDCVIILTDHSQIPIENILAQCKLVYDTRNVTEGLHGKAKVIRLGGGKS